MKAARFLTLIVVLVLMVGIPAPGLAEAGPFEDVDADEFWADAVEYVYSLGLMLGYSDDVFGSLDFFTREQLATVLVRMRNLEPMVDGARGIQATMYADAPADPTWWSHPYLIVAYVNDLMVGEAVGQERYFRPDQYSTFDHVWTTLLRVLLDRRLTVWPDDYRAAAVDMGFPDDLGEPLTADSADALGPLPATRCEIAVLVHYVMMETGEGRELAAGLLSADPEASGVTFAGDGAGTGTFTVTLRDARGVGIPDYCMDSIFLHSPAQSEMLGERVEMSLSDWDDWVFPLSEIFEGVPDIQFAVEGFSYRGDGVYTFVMNPDHDLAPTALVDIGVGLDPDDTTEIETGLPSYIWGNDCRVQGCSTCPLAHTVVDPELSGATSINNEDGSGTLTLTVKNLFGEGIPGYCMDTIYIHCPLQTFVVEFVLPETGLLHPVLMPLSDWNEYSFIGMEFAVDDFAELGGGTYTFIFDPSHDLLPRAAVDIGVGGPDVEDITWIELLTAVQITGNDCEGLCPACEVEHVLQCPDCCPICSSLEGLADWEPRGGAWSPLDP